jgi:hypothetical protein
MCMSKQSEVKVHSGTTMGKHGDRDLELGKALTVTSVRCTGIFGSRNQRLLDTQVGCPFGFSPSMQRLVSREHRTLASYGTWNAVRMYTVLKVGCSCFDSTARCTSTKSFLVLSKLGGLENSVVSFPGEPVFCFSRCACACSCDT